MLLELLEQMDYSRTKQQQKLNKNIKNPNDNHACGVYIVDHFNTPFFSFPVRNNNKKKTDMCFQTTTTKQKRPTEHISSIV